MRAINVVNQSKSNERLLQRVPRNDLVFQSYFLFWDVCESSGPVGQVLHFAFLLGGSLGFR